jgi:hypothetical protein
VKRKVLYDVSSIASTDSKKKRPPSVGYASKKCMYAFEALRFTRVIGSWLTPERATVDVTTKERWYWVGNPNNEMTKKHCLTLSPQVVKHSVGSASLLLMIIPYWQNSCHT